jgi:hypothetical protein
MVRSACSVIFPSLNMQSNATISDGLPRGWVNAFSGMGVPNTRRCILLKNRGRNCRDNVDSGIQTGVKEFMLTHPHVQNKDARERCFCACPPWSTPCKDYEHRQQMNHTYKLTKSLVSMVHPRRYAYGRLVYVYVCQLPERTEDECGAYKAYKKRQGQQNCTSNKDGGTNRFDLMTLTWSNHSPPHDRLEFAWKPCRH